ncbi:TadE/TadG family type IV pilus assembly protein [Natronincola peptidivorans]|nr:TadE/TadG family type IV pilus assembly protein [Natronincola peptidivorans]
MINKLRKSENGQALVELALVLPILLLLVFGMIEFGRVFGTQLVILHGAREGARAAAVGASDTEVVAIVQNRTSPLTLDASKLTVEVTPSDVSRQRGDGVAIQVQYPVKIYAPFISAIMNDSYTVSGRVMMRME